MYQSFVFAAIAPKCKVICEPDTKSHARHITFSVPAHTQRLTKDMHNTGNFMPCSFRIVCGFFNIPQWTYINMEGICETGPTVYRPYPRRLESLTICGFNYKGSAFYSVILRPWVLVQPELTHDLPHDSLMFHHWATGTRFKTLRQKLSRGKWSHKQWLILIQICFFPYLPVKVLSLQIFWV